MAGRGLKCSSENILLGLTLAGVAVGLASGWILRVSLVFGEDEARERQLFLEYLGFLGQLMMRSFKLVMIPVLLTSIISGVTNLGSEQSGKIGKIAFLYYLATTFIAILIGIGLVLVIKPGISPDQIHPQNATLTNATGSSANTQIQFMDLIRNIIPDNIFAATIMTDKTEIHQGYSDNITIAHNETIFKLTKGQNPNILGLVILSIIVALIMASMGEKAKPLKLVIDSVNDVVMKGIMFIMWFVPVGVASLIAKAIYAMDESFQGTMLKVGKYFMTVMIGLGIHWFIILPLIYFLIVRKNPYIYMFGLLRAIVTAFGTSSSACTLPITMQCVEKNLGIDVRISRFILPLGCTVNMDGTALMEGVAAIAISQMEGKVLSIAQICSLSITATLASVGASSIPSAGLIMLTMILTSLGVSTEKIALLWAIDWLLDRFRTVVNIVGDSIGCAVVQRLCMKDLERTTASIPSTKQYEMAESVSSTNVAQTPQKMNGYITEAQTMLNTPEMNGNEVATKV